MIAQMAARAVTEAGHAGKKAAVAEAKKTTVAAREPHVVKPRAAVMNVQPVKLDSNTEPLDSFMLLQAMHSMYARFARMNQNQSVLLTLWAASTWFVDQDGTLMFNEHGRPFMIAPPQSGKTRIMKITRALSRKATGIVKAPVTAPGVREALADGRTVFLDEIDRQIRNGTGHADLQALISAYERDTDSLNGQSGYNAENIYGPMMLGAKPRILTATRGWIEDLFERSFILTPEKYQNVSDPIPELDDRFDEWTKAWRGAMEIWAEAVRFAQLDAGGSGTLLKPVHDIPRALLNEPRMKEIAAPLLAVADRAVSPEYMTEHGSDTRWAVQARESVQAVLLGHGSNGNEILRSTIASMADAGIQV